MNTFLKWAGNKQRIADRILSLLPPGERLVEPFVGSGAVFLHSNYPAYLLADANPDLIGLFVTLQTDGEAFIATCRELFTPEMNQPEAFYALREEFNQSGDARRKAALFLYLNRHGYNGLCRYNQSGGFNVPFGRYKRPYFPQAEMAFFLQRLRASRVTFAVQPFRATFAQTRPGDVIYCDPPYVPLSATASFTSYSAGGFDEAEQRDLAQAAQEAADRGIPVLLSNHDTPFTRAIYAQASTIEAFPVQRFISAKGDQREKAGELLSLFSA